MLPFILLSDETFSESFFASLEVDSFSLSPEDLVLFILSLESED